MNFIISYYSYTLIIVRFTFIATDTTYQPAIFALQNYLYAQPTGNANTQVVNKSKTERELEEDDDDDDEEEYDYQPPRIVFKPLIVVLMEQLGSLGGRLAFTKQGAESSEEEVVVRTEKKKEAESSFFGDALTLPFKLLQAYGIPALSNYIPATDQLKTYGQFYQSLTRSADTKATAELKEEVEEFKENLRKGSQKSAINGRRPSTYEMFNEFFPYAIILLKLGSYFVPGLGQVKTALIALEVIRISWKTASMYNNGDSWFDIAQGLGREIFTAAIGRRAELGPLTNPACQTAFVDVSSMDLDTLLALAQESEYPPLKDEDEAVLQEDITIVVNSYFKNEGLSEERKAQIIATIEKVAKFIALHAIMPALSSNFGSTKNS